jgi:tryptophan-rich sensory protein
MMRINTLSATAAAVTATALAGAAATSGDVNSPWYAQLRKPRYQPPRQAFPIVWPLLYGDIALVSAAVIDRLTEQNRAGETTAYRAALAVNLVLNASWSWVFFNRHRTGLAAVTAAALTASSADLTRRAVAAEKGRAAPLAAYPAWCAFATMLSTHIWWINRRG